MVNWWWKNVYHELENVFVTVLKIVLTFVNLVFIVDHDTSICRH